MGFFSSENMHKAGWWLIFFFAALVIPSIISGYTTRGEDIAKGRTAYEQNEKIHPQVDSIGRAVKQETQNMRNEWREFRLERKIVDSVVIESLKEIKQEIRKK